MMPLHTLLKPLCSMLLAGFACAALAAPQHALTLYDEPPKYPANFKHVEYVNPDAPKGGSAGRRYRTDLRHPGPFNPG